MKRMGAQLSLFGWCSGPDGSTLDHRSCIVETGSASGIRKCECPCHGEGAST